MKKLTKKLQVRSETIKQLGTRDLRLAGGGVRTIFDSYFLNCETSSGGQHTDNLCETAAGPCHTDWVSCESNYFGCPSNGGGC